MSQAPTNVRLYNPADYAEWLRMRSSLWPELAKEDTNAALEAAEWLARPDAVTLVIERQDSKGLAGFAELAARPYADGCLTSPVAYIEGWYVDPDLRHRGLGAALVHAAEVWARAQGYRELASDALLENISSQRAHESLGFAEVERSVKYVKPL